MLNDLVSRFVGEFIRSAVYKISLIGRTSHETAGGVTVILKNSIIACGEYEGCR